MNTSTKKPEIKVCTIEGCENKHCSRGYCIKHYKRWKRNGSPLKTVVNVDHDGKCTFEGCNDSYYSKGFCIKHYGRLLAHGDPSVVISRKIVGKCKVETCKSDIHCQGYCTKHYQKFLKYGDPLHIVKDYDVPELCTVEDCKNKYYSNGLCKKHNARFRRYGDVKTLKKSPNTISDRCKVNACKEPHFGKGFCKHHYYKSDDHKQKSQRRRAMKSNAPFNDFDEIKIPEINKYFNKSCAYCGENLNEFHIEHVVPLSSGGSHTLNNIVLSCPRCNYSKNAKSLEEWYPLQTFYTREREERILNWMGYKIKDNKIQMQLF